MDSYFEWSNHEQKQRKDIAVKKNSNRNIITLKVSPTNNNFLKKLLVFFFTQFSYHSLSWCLRHKVVKDSNELGGLEYSRNAQR